LAFADQAQQSWMIRSLDHPTFDAQQLWVHVNSRKAEGVEGYKVDYAKDPNAFPEPKWPKHTRLTTRSQRVMIPRIVEILTWDVTEERNIVWLAG